MIGAPAGGESDPAFLAGLLCENPIGGLCGQAIEGGDGHLQMALLGIFDLVMADSPQ